MQNLAQILTDAALVPVVALEDATIAGRLVEALVAGGVSIVEFTLRTDSALLAIERVSKNFPEVVVGAGTVCSAEQARACIEAGVNFVVSPGFSPEVADVCSAKHVPYLPGAVTPTEIQTLVQLGYSCLKFFPAEASGGLSMLQALRPVFPSVSFCATGGITPENASSYIAQANVCAVGMSQLTPSALIKDRRWSEITAIARDLVAATK